MLRNTCALFVVMVTLRLVSSAYRTANCLDRCEFEIRNTDALVVYAEDILSFQRFFDPGRLGAAAQEVTSLHVICSKALLGETVTAFQASWAPLTSRLLRLHLQQCRIMSFSPQAFQEFQCLTSLVVDNRNEGSPFVSSHGGLRGLPSLASFTLTRVRLRYIGRDLFQNASKHNLLKVYLNHNYLTKVDEYTFCGMRRLSDLDLSHNRLSNNRVDFLACIPSLYLFNISNNSIRELEKSAFARNPMLHVLDLSHNNFTSVNTLIDLVNNTKSLKKLYLSGNPLVCNLTSLSRLHHLASQADIHVVDWEVMLCLQNEEWVSVQDLLFPYGFRRLFRVWHVAVVVTVFLVCFCCCLGLRYHADHPEVASQTALWQVIHRCFVGAATRRHSQAMQTKLPQTNTCISILHCTEGEHLAGPRYEEVIGELKHKRSITVKDVGTQSPFAIKRETESNDDIANAIRSEEAQEVCQSTYISYKTQLEPDSQQNAQRPESAVLKVLDGLEASEGDLRQEGGARSPAEQECQSEERSNEVDFEDDLPLSTSAGVATTPTETQTVAMAGMRSVTQYTLESWLTVEPPHVTSVLAPPAPEPPTPLQLLAAKMRHQTPAGTFTLHSPPVQAREDRGDAGQRLVNGRALRGSAKHSPVSRNAGRLPVPRHEQHLQQHLLPATKHDNPVAPEKKEASGTIWQTDVRMANISDEQLVCRSCLEALSLPDVNSPGALLNGTGSSPIWSRSLNPNGRRSRTSASMKSHKMSHSASVEGDGQACSPDNANSGVKKQTSHVDKPVYRSLERGTRRGPAGDPGGTLDPHRHATLPLTNVAALSLRPQGSALELNAVNPHLERIDEQLSRARAKPATSEICGDAAGRISSAAQTDPSGEMTAERNAATGHSTGASGCASPPGNGRDASPCEISTSPETAAATSGQCPAPEVVGGDECSCRCEAHQPAKVKSDPGDGDAGDGEHCEIDIETQATQIIDMVELHAQSSCNPS